MHQLWSYGDLTSKMYFSIDFVYCFYTYSVRVTTRSNSKRKRCFDSFNWCHII